MTIQLKFPASPRTPARNMAIELAVSSGGTIENGIVSLVFENHNDPKLFNLVNQIYQWKNVRFFVDGIEYDPRNYLYVKECRNKFDCNGVCSNLVGPVQADSAEMIFTQLKEGEWRPQYSATHFEGQFGDPESPEQLNYPFIEEISNYYVINKKSLMEHIVKRHFIEKLFCEIFSEEKIQQEIDQLPEKMKIK